MKNNIEQEIRCFLSQHPGGVELFNILNETGDVFCAGGLLREYREKGNISDLRDADFAVLFRDKGKWNNYCENANHKKNRFGGYKFIFAEFAVDVWDVTKTWGIEHGYVKVENGNYLDALAKSTFLNIESIFYDIQRQQWADDLYLRALDSRQLDIVQKYNPYPDFCLLKAIRVRRKYGFIYSEELKDMMREQVKKNPEYSRILHKLQTEKHYKNILSEAEIQSELDIATK